jgi:hypothetical protein
LTGIAFVDGANEAAALLICLSSPPRKNFSLFFRRKSPAYGRYPVPHRRGVGHRHGRWAWDAMDAEVPLTNGADADGEVVWF